LGVWTQASVWPELVEIHYLVALCWGLYSQRHDNQHNNIQHNDTQHNDIQLNNKWNTTLSIMTPLWNYTDCWYAECRKETLYAACRYAECRYAQCNYTERHGAVFSTLYFLHKVWMGQNKLYCLFLADISRLVLCKNSSLLGQFISSKEN
jgi:hypothetical protein